MDPSLTHGDETRLFLLRLYLQLFLKKQAHADVDCYKGKHQGMGAQEADPAQVFDTECCVTLYESLNLSAT